MNRKLAILFIVYITSGYINDNDSPFKASINIGVSSVSHDSIANIEQRFDEILALETWLKTRSRLGFDTLNNVDPVMSRTRLGRLFVKKGADLAQPHQSSVYLLPISIETDKIKVELDEKLLTVPTGQTTWANEAFNIEETLNNSNPQIAPTERLSKASIYTKNYNRYTSNWLWSKGFRDASSVGWRDHTALTSYKDNEATTSKTATFGLSAHPYDIAGSMVQLDDIRELKAGPQAPTSELGYISIGGTQVWPFANSFENATSLFDVYPTLAYPLKHFLYPNSRESRPMIPYNQIQLVADDDNNINTAALANHEYLTTKVIVDAKTDQTDTTGGTNWPYADYPALLISEQQFETMKSIADDFKRSTKSKSIDLINHSHFKLLDATLNARYQFDKIGFTINLSGHYPLGFASRNPTKLVTYTPGLTFDLAAGVAIPFERGIFSTTIGSTFQRGSITVNRYSDESGKTLKYIDYDKSYSTKKKASTRYKEFSETLYFLEFTAETAVSKSEISYFGRYRKVFRNSVDPSIDLISHQQDVVSVGASFIIL